MDTRHNNRTTTKILLLEDDASLIDGLEYSLLKNGFQVETVRTVNDALNRLFQSTGALHSHPAAQTPDRRLIPDTSPDDPQIFRTPANDLSSQYSLLLLDVTLPDGTGFEVCEKVREQDHRIPIIFLTASDEEVNVIRGLDSGADDYITKPFKIGELCSRIRALLRRSAISRQMPAHTLSGRQAQTPCPPASETITSGGLRIDFLAGSVCLDGQTVDLTRAEYRLLSLLVRSAGRTVTRDLILNELWDSAGDFVDDNTLSVYMRRLREKIEADPSRPEHLITVRGFGYRWEP